MIFDIAGCKRFFLDITWNVCLVYGGITCHRATRYRAFFLGGSAVLKMNGMAVPAKSVAMNLIFRLWLRWLFRWPQCLVRGISSGYQKSILNSVGWNSPEHISVCGTQPMPQRVTAGMSTQTAIFVRFLIPVWHVASYSAQSHHTHNLFLNAIIRKKVSTQFQLQVCFLFFSVFFFLKINTSWQGGKPGKLYRKYQPVVLSIKI